MDKGIDELRQDIDKLDDELIQILAKRMNLVKQIVDLKNKDNIHLYDPDREKQIIDAKSKLAQELGLSAGLVESIFEKIFEKTRGKK